MYDNVGKEWVAGTPLKRLILKMKGLSLKRWLWECTRLSNVQTLRWGSVRSCSPDTYKLDSDYALRTTCAWDFGAQPPFLYLAREWEVKLTLWSEGEGGIEVGYDEGMGKPWTLAYSSVDGLTGPLEKGWLTLFSAWGAMIIIVNSEHSCPEVFGSSAYLYVSECLALPLAGSGELLWLLESGNTLVSSMMLAEHSVLFDNLKWSRINLVLPLEGTLRGLVAHLDVELWLKSRGDKIEEMYDNRFSS